MGIEIERKFLVDGTKWRDSVEQSMRYQQAYLSRDPDRTVRIRIVERNAWITVKSSTDGLRRSEFEYAIPLEDAVEMMKMCERPLVEKTRHLLRHAGNLWEIDEFAGENAGLIVAEIELESEDQDFEKPSWAGEEVTQDSRYYNSQLSKTPFLRW